jgi:hypothetical protein
MITIAGLQFPKFWRKGGAPKSPTYARKAGPTDIDRCAAEIAAVWRDHQTRVLPHYMKLCSLDQQIEKFSPGAFQIIHNYRSLGEVSGDHLWMIYFKGLLVSETHPAKEMKASIRMVAYRHLAR